MASFRAKSISPDRPLNILSRACPKGWSHYFLKHFFHSLLACQARVRMGQSWQARALSQRLVKIGICFQGALDGDLLPWTRLSPLDSEPPRFTGVPKHKLRAHPEVTRGGPLSTIGQISLDECLRK